MNGRRTFLGNAAAAAVMAKISSLRSFGFAMEGPEMIPTMSDREKAGLRGPVKTCVEEIKDGSKYLTTTEYSPDGRLHTFRTTNSDGSEWIRTQTYDADGRLVKIISGKMGEPSTEMLYAYDEAGRLLTITNSPGMGCRIDFHYDRQRHKTSIQKFSPEVFKGNQGVMVESVWTAAQAGVGIPLGGSVTTIYDDLDRQTELQIRDAEDRLVSQIARNYDGNGRLVEEEPIQENAALFFADEFGAEGGPQPTAAQLEAMNGAMKSMFSGRSGTGISYAYDAQGRVTEMRERNSWFDKVTTTSYNEHGDKSAERETITRNSAVPVGVAFSVDENGTVIPVKRTTEPTYSPDLSREEEVRYAYRYDSYGNWTQQTVNHGSSPDTLDSRSRRYTYERGSYRTCSIGLRGYALGGVNRLRGGFEGFASQRQK